MCATGSTSSTAAPRSPRARRPRSVARSTWPPPTSARPPSSRTPMPEPLLSVAGLDVRYGPVPAVRGVELEVHGGEIVGLIGPNGAGKSTTLHALMGLQPVHTGEIRLEGTPLRGLRPEAIARLGLALVPEGRRIYADFTVEENLRLGLVARGERRGAEHDLAWIHELFPVVREFRDRPAGALSGGQQQQLAIARALAAGPRVLLLD